MGCGGKRTAKAGPCVPVIEGEKEKRRKGGGGRERRDKGVASSGPRESKQRHSPTYTTKTRPKQQQQELPPPTQVQTQPQRGLGLKVPEPSIHGEFTKGLEPSSLIRGDLCVARRHDVTSSASPHEILALDFCFSSSSFLFSFFLLLHVPRAVASAGSATPSSLPCLTRRLSSPLSSSWIPFLEDRGHRAFCTA